MKTRKSLGWGIAAASAALLLVGAKDEASERPANVAASRWLKLSDTAGIVLTDELAATRQLAGSVYIRTENGWRPVSILNPAAGRLLNETAPRR
jgi:hypothetical protein